MKLGLSFLALVVALVVGTHFTLFYDPLNDEQQQMNQAGAAFTQENEALGEQAENAPLNTDKRTAAEDSRNKGI